MTWPHAPSLATLLWVTAAVPFTIWDSLYIFLRPHMLPGGKWHLPLWSPYTTYAAVDHIYGHEAWEENNGFAGAQCVMNLVESSFYLWYFWLVCQYGRTVERRSVGWWRVLGWYADRRVVEKKEGALAVLVGLLGGVMTASKTVLHGEWVTAMGMGFRPKDWANDELVLNEIFSGFHHVGHNDLITLLSCWAVMVCIYFGFSIHMTYTFSRDILNGLDIANSELGPRLATRKKKD